MSFLVTCSLVGATVLAGIQHSLAASVPPNHELEGILGKLSSTTSSDQYRQIDEAVKSSPHLIEMLNGLAASGKLTQIVVLTSATASNAPKPGLSAPGRPARR